MWPMPLEDPLPLERPVWPGRQPHRLTTLKQSPASSLRTIVLAQEGHWCLSQSQGSPGCPWT